MDRGRMLAANVVDCFALAVDATGKIVIILCSLFIVHLLIPPKTSREIRTVVSAEGLGAI